MGVIESPRRVDENPWIMTGGVEVQIPDESFRSGFHIAVDQPKQTQPDRQHDEALGSFESGNHPQSKTRRHDYLY